MKSWAFVILTLATGALTSSVTFAIAQSRAPVVIESVIVDVNACTDVH